MTAVYSGFLLLIICSSFIGQSWERPWERPAGEEEEVRCEVAGCHYDMNLYCLSTGELVMGSCQLKQRLCTGGARNNVVAMDIFQCLSPNNINVQEPGDQQMR